MPQLDKYTFLSQFFWCTATFGIFYFFILKLFLPKMVRLIGVRKLAISQKAVDFLLQENDFVRNIFDVQISKGLNLSYTEFNWNSQRLVQWLKDLRLETNQTHFQTVNMSYITFLGENSLKTNWDFSQTGIHISEKFLTSLLLGKLDQLVDLENPLENPSPTVQWGPNPDAYA